MRWIEFPDERILVEGLAWFDENTPRLSRLPIRAKGRVRAELWELAQCPTGARISLRSDSGRLSVKIICPSLPQPPACMSLIGQRAFELYQDNKFWSVAVPEAEGEQTIELYEGYEGKTRQFQIYLPTYVPTRLVAVGVDDDSVVVGVNPAYVITKPIVFYGSSITHGAAASRPSLTFPARIARRLDADWVNLGFSGNAHADIEIARYMSEIDAACFVVSVGINLFGRSDFETMTERFGKFLAAIRSARPETPILCPTALYSVREQYGVASGTHALEDFRGVVRKEVASLRAKGDEKVWIVEGPNALGAENSDGLADQTHPNDHGFTGLVEVLSRTIEGILKTESEKAEAAPDVS